MTETKSNTRNLWVGVLLLTLVLGAVAASPPAASGAGFIDKDTFYYLNISYFRGGFLSDSRLIVKINNRKANFFGEEYSNIMRYGGTDMAIVNDFLVRGKNTIAVEIERVKDGSGADKEPCILHVVLEMKRKGEIVDTGKSVSPIFEMEKTLELPSFKEGLIGQGEFLLHDALNN